MDTCLVCRFVAHRRTLGGRADGVHELPHAVDHLHHDLLRARVRTVRAFQLSRTVLLRARRLDIGVALVAMVAEAVSLRSLRVGVAKLDVLATSTDAALRRKPTPGNSLSTR